MEAQPLRTVPPADSGRGGGPKNSWDKAWRMMVEGKGGSVKEGSPSIKLGLGIGASGSGQSAVIEHGKAVFTAAQLKELEQQDLIFKYMAAGLPVPLYLVLSIWKSVARSFGPANGGIYKQYPTFVGFSPQGFDYRNMMDPEPGRCRRTDGKKWRCSKDVVLDQKYCERHMHRGRQRSRKHVEASEIASPSGTTPPFNDDNSKNSNTNPSISVPMSLQLGTLSSNTESTSKNTASTICTIGNNDNNNNDVDNKDSTAAATTTTAAATSTTNKNSDNIDDDDNSSNVVNDYCIVNRNSNNGNNNNAVSIVSRGFGFSPKSVLQGGTILGCYSGFDYRSYADPEPGRCRRTDGKKWRCSKNVVPDRKYCVRHMHRGAKRHVGASQPPAAAAAVAAVINKADPTVNMDTNLSLSIAANSQVMTNDEKSTTSSSDDTISTTSTANEYSNVSHSLVLSP